MDNIFQIQETKRYNKINYDIVINRKPSEIPISIDRELSYMGCIVDLDGPNSRVTYQFFEKENQQKAIEFLIRCGWIENKEI